MIGAASLAIAGKKPEALAELVKARDGGHNDHKLLEAIGHLQFELRLFESAAKSYEEALALHPEDSVTHYNRAVCLEKLQLWDLARSGFQKAAELDSRRASAHLGLGISELRLDH